MGETDYSRTGPERAGRHQGAGPAAARGARMTDVARLADVSIMTVSRALRQPASSIPIHLKRIDGAIDATGYLPNRIAGSLASQRSNIVGLVVPSLRNSLSCRNRQGRRRYAEPANFDLMIADSGYVLDGEETAVAAFLSQRVCGIVLHNTKHTPRCRH